MEPSERLKTLIASKMSAMKEKLGANREPAGSRVRADPATVAALLKEWPSAPRKVAQDALQRYGMPNEVSYSRLIWYRNGPWKRTVIVRDEIPHNFPTPHTDFITQSIDYHVPVERLSDLARFDGSVIVDRTAGEVAARCDMEAMNILTLNLMHDIVADRLTVEQAREKYTEEAAAHMLDRAAPYTERLLFDRPGGETADLDESMIGGAMLHQAGEKAKDALGRDEPKH
jgi:hypothetical protein